MPSTVYHRLTHAQRAEVRKCLRTFHRDWVSSHISQGQAAAILTDRLGFTVTLAHISRNSIFLRLRWPHNPHPRRGRRSSSTPTPTPRAEPVRVPGKRLTHEAIDSLRSMANGLLEYAAAIEFIINTGHPFDDK